MHTHVTVTLDGGQIVAAVILAAAFAAAVVYLGRPIAKAVRLVFALHEIAERELEHNHGGSMKDDMHGVAIAVGSLQRQFEDHIKTHHT